MKLNTGIAILRLDPNFPLAKSLSYYRDEFGDPKRGMAAAYATGDYTLQAIADAFGVHYSTISRAVSGKRMLCCKT